MQSYYIRQYCCENKLFSAGSSYQYDKMFSYHQENPNDLYGLATIIWVCSTTTKSIKEIEQYLYRRLMLHTLIEFDHFHFFLKYLHRFLKNCDKYRE